MDVYSEDSTDLDIDYRGRRYGLDPQYAQSNGTFFIDQRTGYIHFGSSLAGETVILKYISDSLGTEDEIRVHKLAEEAIYKYTAWAILSARSLVPEYMVARFKKEKFADALNFMEKYHIIRSKVEYDSKYHDEILKALHDKMKEKFGNVETLDGLKTIVNEDSWILVRKSNTENVIRVSTESNSLEKVRNIDQEIKDLIKESYEQIK